MEALGWTVAVVFLVAGYAKLTSGPWAIDRAIAMAELVIGSSILWLTGLPAQVSALASAVTCSVYAIHALTEPHGSRCACFGRRLPTTGREGQRARNAALMMVASVYAVLRWRNPNTVVASAIIEGAVGVSAGLWVIVAPWLFEWARRDGYSDHAESSVPHA